MIIIISSLSSFISKVGWLGCLQCEDVCGKTWKANKGFFGTSKDLLKFGRYGHELLAETLVSCDGDTVLSHHGYHRATIILHNRLEKSVNQRSSVAVLEAVLFQSYHGCECVLLLEGMRKRKKGE